MLGNVQNEGGKKKKRQKNITLRAGFEPARGDPIGFQVQRLNHSAITAYTQLCAGDWQKGWL